MLFLSGHRSPRVTDEPNMAICILKQNLSKVLASLTLLLTGGSLSLGKGGETWFSRIQASADSSAHTH